MYLDFYQLKVKPFQITVDPKFLWLGEKHKEALATLRYGIVDNRGFLLLTGEVGTGKTILINRITSMLDMDTVVATLPDPDLESMDFYNMLADGLNMKRTFESKGAFLIHLRDFLHQSYANQQQVLLIIDESQRLNSKLMEDIRVLSNIELHDRKLINIFFVGQQEFNSILMTPQNRALAQRITVRYHIDALDQDETGEYIKHRLLVAGRKKQLFEDPALKEIFFFSGGIPRLINIISDHALLTAYAQGIKRISGDVIKECAEELRIPVQKTHSEAATLKPAQEDANLSSEQGKAIEENKQASSSVLNSESAQVKNPPIEEKAPPAAWKLANVMMILLLIAVVVYAINQFSGGEAIQYDETELTPKKYKTSLEKEKEILSDRLAQSEADAENDKAIEDVEAKRKQEQASSNTSVVRAVESQVVVGSDEDPADDAVAATDQVVPVEETGPDAGEEAPSKVEPRDLAPTEDPKVDAVVTTSKLDSATDTSQVSSSRDTSGQGTGTVEKKIEIEPLPLMKETTVIQFEINSNEIEPQSYALLDRVASYLVLHTDKKVYIRGYTDSSGSHGYNESVSRFRASVVKTYLIGKGVYPENMEVQAMGADNPMASNDTFAGRKLNRRVEIDFYDETEGQP